VGPFCPEVQERLRSSRWSQLGPRNHSLILDPSRSIHCSIFHIGFQKIRPDNEIFEVREKPGPEMPNMAPSVTNNADLTDAREINFEYLKHVVLKFMSCRESEVKSF
jgi:hypothetical protein